METFRADLHIHTVLSPCGDLEMSPANIVHAAKEKNIDIIGITDHNSTKQCEVIKQVACSEGIFVMTGAEVTTKEEVHCLTFFETTEKLFEFQQYLDLHLPDIKNDTKLFGYQVVVDKEENIVEEEDRLLISALDQSLEDIEKKVHQLGGLFIPAHINKSKFSIISQLGFVPADLQFEALEISKHVSKTDFLSKNRYLNKFTFIQDSDAHYVENIGEISTRFLMEEISFEEIRMALAGINGREVIVG